MVELLLSYDVPALLCFGALAFLAARMGGWAGVFVGHFILAACVAVLDVMWIQDEMARPGWDGSPDMDILFHFGLILRVVSINTVLLPISLIGVWRHHKFAAEPRAAYWTR